MQRRAWQNEQLHARNGGMAQGQSLLKAPEKTPMCLATTWSCHKTIKAGSSYESFLQFVALHAAAIGRGLMSMPR